MAFPVFGAFQAFRTGWHCFMQHISWRQYQKNCEKNIPPELKNRVDQETFDKSQAYQKDKQMFSIITSAVSFIIETAFLLVGNVYFWNKAVELCGAENEIQCSLAWMFMLHMAGLVYSLPISLYSDFVLEEKHGFNKKTIGLFFSDLVKREFLAYVLAGILVPALIKVVHWGGEYFYIYCWAMIQILQIVFIIIYPNVIMPMFNKFEQLKDEDLRVKIEELAESEKFPLQKLYQMDGSKRSSHSNAFFYGFGSNKRIVLFDTLLHLPQDQILAILCHEIGHWQHSHLPQRFAFQSVYVFCLFWLYGLVMNNAAVTAAFGYNTTAVMVGLTVFGDIISPVSQALELGVTLLSRKHEFQADGHAVKMDRAEGLREGLFAMTLENLGDLNPDPWFAFFHFSHPALVERVRAIDQAAAEKSKKE